MNGNVFLINIFCKDNDSSASWFLAESNGGNVMYCFSVLSYI